MMMASEGSKNARDNFGKFIHPCQPDTQTVIRKLEKIYVECLREFRRDSVGRGQWHFHQDNAPVHISIFVTDYLTKMGI